jgi:hypothetical protein
MTKRKKKKIVKRHQTQRHHICPKSRNGSSHRSNICRINEKNHQAYHFLFWNMTPDEIIKELVKNYWNGQIQWLQIALKELEEEYDTAKRSRGNE